MHEGYIRKNENNNRDGKLPFVTLCLYKT